jgi:hypothetical protein
METVEETLRVLARGELDRFGSGPRRRVAAWTTRTVVRPGDQHPTFESVFDYTDGTRQVYDGRAWRTEGRAAG